MIKLYERWEQKYGRKWPENGLNTEDLVWLYNEAYQDEQVCVFACLCLLVWGAVGVEDKVFHCQEQ